MTYRLVQGGVTLRAQMDKRFPLRDKSSDGWIGDAAHQARPSDHNPDAYGWVHAIDLDKDFGAPGDDLKLANQLIEYAREGKDHGRLKYVVYRDKVASGTYRDQFWVWRGHGYEHFDHIHVSFTDHAKYDGTPFRLPIFDPEKPAWDGVIPDIDAVQKAAFDPSLANKAAWRVASRLYDKGFFKGGRPVLYEQRYPEIAVTAFQKSRGWQGTGNYGPLTHKALFG